MTSEEMERIEVLLRRRRAEFVEYHRQERYRHCHWTYRHGAYVSPWFWPTQADAEHASRSLPPDPRATERPEVYPVHGAECTCATDDEEVPA